MMLKGYNLYRIITHVLYNIVYPLVHLAIDFSIQVQQQHMYDPLTLFRDHCCSPTLHHTPSSSFFFAATASAVMVSFRFSTVDILCIQTTCICETASSAAPLARYHNPIHSHRCRCTISFAFCRCMYGRLHLLWNHIDCITSREILWLGLLVLLYLQFVCV